MLARIDAYESSVHAANGDPVAALAAARRAIEGARATGEEEALARAYGSLDWANFMLGNDEPRMGGEAVEIFNRLGQVDRSAMTLNMMGAFAYLEGDWTGAVEWYERSVAAAESSGNAFHAANTRANIAEVLIGQRRPEDAIPLLEEADRFFQASRSELVKPFVRWPGACVPGDVRGIRAGASLRGSAGERLPWPETVIAPPMPDRRRAGRHRPRARPVRGDDANRLTVGPSDRVRRAAYPLATSSGPVSSGGRAGGGRR